MKITLSKAQWELIGEKTGWLKIASVSAKAEVVRRKLLDIHNTQGQKEMWKALDQMVETHMSTPAYQVSPVIYEKIVLQKLGGWEEMDPTLKIAVEFAFKEHLDGYDH